ncbi:MAG: hydrogenase expression/formation protein HypE [Bacteroidetes bacterium]|nr:hydrogenase expression/formation protein HypE [Bacteroidota bacterium]
MQCLLPFSKKLNMEISCPIPVNDYPRIVMAHGGGGKLSNTLIEQVLLKELDNPYLRQMHDGALLPVNGKIALTTDSFVVQPIFFPGGDIGELAIYGTVNDLVCCGSKPRYISLGLILEEGLEVETLRQIVKSIRIAADKSGVAVVTGDTKVVEKGKGDKIFINTAGIGEQMPGLDIHPVNIRPGDKIIINGSIAEHGIAILSSREGLQFGTEIQSDAAPMIGLLETIYKETKEIHCMRDPTRGGLASACNELAKSANLGITLWESAIPLKEEVKGACEILGFDPLYVANEGKMLFFVPDSVADMVLNCLQNHPLGVNASIIGEVTDEKPLVKLKTVIGSHRIVDMISGEQLPRIC